VKLQLSERTKGIHVGEIWPSKLDHPITVTIIESLGQFVPYIEGRLASDACKTLEEAAIILTDAVEYRYGSLQIIAQTERDHILFADERSQRSDRVTIARTISQRAASRRSRQVASPSYRTQPSSLHSPAHVRKKPAVIVPAIGGAVAASVVAIAALFTSGILSIKPVPTASDQIGIASILDYEITVDLSVLQFPGAQQTNTGTGETTSSVVTVGPDEGADEQSDAGQSQMIAGSTATSSVVRTVTAPASSVVQTVTPSTSSVVRTVSATAATRNVPTSSVVRTVEAPRKTIVAEEQRSTSDTVTTVATIEPTTGFQTTSADAVVATAQPQKPKKDEKPKQEQVSTWQKFFGFED